MMLRGKAYLRMQHEFLPMPSNLGFQGWLLIFWFDSDLPDFQRVSI